MSEHKCHAIGCQVNVDPKFLLCPAHWRLVPFPLKKRVWQHYRRDQEVTKNPSKDYLNAAKAAIVAVAHLEGR